MEISISNTDGKLRACLNGRLDTLCAPQCEKDLEPIRKNSGNENIIDCSGLGYISSSGLRIFLSLLKKVKNDGGTLVLENVNDEIKNIFTITGFHKLFTIK
ncbi:MAG: hypothetical protein BHV69_02495 [Bacteroidales bacterium 52_46]|nr:MAG: hypothetical protein BHV69_02495 [Bacteroidales bacterium 52_46]